MPSPVLIRSNCRSHSNPSCHLFQALGECIAAALVLKEGLEPEQVQPKAFGGDAAANSKSNSWVADRLGFFLLGKNMTKFGGSYSSQGLSSQRLHRQVHVFFFSCARYFLGPRVHPNEPRYSDDHSWDTILGLQQLFIGFASRWCEDILSYTEKELSDVMKPEA